MTDVQARLRPALADRYTIERELGHGGMATVYLAEDLRHGRQVAIKVLHPELSAVLGPDRFLAEIKLTAALQHANILPLFDSGAADGLLFYVMPFVEGETLRTRLARERQLPIADALRIATEVADALGYAHGRGIIHRDIKPENILIRGGHAVVADFGIALAVQQAGGERMTQTGMSLGTPQYMAPEQAMGDRGADHRADIYAVAAVTYEMLAGEPPFTGPTSQSIVAKVMTEDPKPLALLRRSVPEAVETAVMTGLEKLPADRYGSAAEFVRALGSAEGQPRRAAARPRRVGRAALAGGIVLALAALGGAYLLGREARPAAVVAPASRLALVSPDLGGSGVASQYRQIALTPDGDAIVFVAITRENQNQLAYQRLDAAGYSLIEGSVGLLSPQISPDGKSLIAYGAGRFSGEQERAMRLPLAGGTPTVLEQGVQSVQAHWAEDGTYWFSQSPNGGVTRLDADGKVVPMLGGRTDGMQLQQVLPDGRTGLVVRATIGTTSGPVQLIDLESGETRTLVEVPTVEARTAAGFLLQLRPDGTMWAAPFDAREQQLTGGQVQIADNVSLTGGGNAQWSVSRSGTVAYMPEEPRSLVLAGRDGAMRPAIELQRNFHAPRFSPEGRSLAVDFTSSDGRDVWILSLAQRTLSRATFTRDGHDATWSPDGRGIVFTSFGKAGTAGLHHIRPGSGTVSESLFASPKLAYTGIWAPGGESLVSVATDLGPGTGADLVTVGAGGKGPISPLLVDRFDTQYPALSPDGRWLAFVSNQSGIQQVYVRPFAGEGDQVQVSQDGGNEPVWDPGGRELFYFAQTASGTQMMSAAVQAAPAFEVTSRRMLFDVSEIVGANPHASYDISPDGRTFAMVRRSPASRIVILQNLPELVRRLREADQPGR